MNNFHVYEAIGRGKHSTVYKGRKKKTLEYYAIKSVDKSQRTKVLQEVRALHSLDHPNVLKFFSCYETSAHLWLVLEYCVGGDLMTLLRQDNRLPEESIHDLARDLVKALQYLHSRGMVYCDLKPSNILLDENGRMKLCDFGLARQLSEISKSSLSSLPQAKRGTPCYMAPELFQDGGVNSYASDFWALGCVLYECYVGRPPFIGTEFTQLVNSILSDPVPTLPDNTSNSLRKLIDSLLVKNPSERVQWPELCEHAFWRTKFEAVPLPSQPAFQNMLRLYHTPRLSERTGDRARQQHTPPKNHERETSRAQKLGDHANVGPKGYATPVKTTFTTRKTQTKNLGRVDDKKGDAAKATNIMRLSRIAKRNLLRENEKENYRREMPKAPEQDVEVNILNNDMELDFSETHDEDAVGESEVPEEVPSTPGEKSPNQAGEEALELLQALNVQDNLSDNNTSDNVEKPKEHDICTDNVDAATIPATPSSQKKSQHDVVVDTPDFDSSKCVNDLSIVMWHPSDLSVKPVMPSRKFDKAYDGIATLPFETPSADDYIKLSRDMIEALNSNIIQHLSSASQLSERQNALKYLEVLSSNSDAANLLINGPVMPVLVKMLRLSKTPLLRAQLASVMGLLIRHSTFIGVDFASSGIMNALIDGLRDKQDKVRRFSMAALGELLFYVSTQNDLNKDSNTLESPSKDNRNVSGWQVPSSVISLVSSILRKGEDDVTQLYALKTFENIFSQGGEWVTRFTSQDVIGNLCYIYKAIGKPENTRVIAGSCLVRLVRFIPTSITPVFERLSVKEIAYSLVKCSPREQQIRINLLNVAMQSNQMAAVMNRQLLTEEKHLVPDLISIVEQGSEILRGKTLILIAFLCKHSRRWLPHFFSNGKLLSSVDRLAKEKDSYMKNCIEAFVQFVVATLPGTLETVRCNIQQMLGSRRPGHIANLSGRSNLKSTSILFPVILHLLGSSSFKHRVVTSQVLQLLASILKLLESPFQGRDDFQITLLQILESICEDTTFLTDDPKIFISCLLPSLATMYKGNKDGDARFLSLKILFDVMATFLNDILGISVQDDESILQELKAVSDNYFLPLYPSLVDDEDPIPMYAQKLLVMLLEFNLVKISSILNQKIISHCFQFLLGDLSVTNVNNVKLCLVLVSAPEMETRLLSQLRVVRKIGNLLELVIAKEMTDFLDPTLALCKAFILHSVGREQSNEYLEEPSLLVDTSKARTAEQQYNIKDIADFSCNVGIFLELTGNPESQVAILASECLVLLLTVAPREATMGFLTNLSKISSILPSFQDGPLLLRLMYSLAFACRQYLCQAMILSISLSDVRKIEAITSRLRNSSTSTVSQAATILAVELQRLPRCI